GLTEGPLPIDALGPTATVVDKGKVLVIDNQVDQTTGTVKLKAEFPNANLQLWPGQFVNVRLLIETLYQIVVVPTAAVQRGPSGTYVYVVQADNTVTVRPVTVRLQDDQQAALQEGLRAGEIVVTSGFGRLREGERVAIDDSQGQVDPGGKGKGKGKGGKGQRTTPAAEQPDEPAMSVSSPFIRRPIATSLLGIAVLLGGVLGYTRLPISSLPQVDFPTIQVTTQLPGASPDTMAALVTAPLERAFGQIPSLQVMTSSSSFGISQVTLQFELNRDIDSAAQ